MLCFCPVRDRFNNRSINTRLGVNVRAATVKWVDKGFSCDAFCVCMIFLDP